MTNRLILPALLVTFLTGCASVGTPVATGNGIAESMYTEQPWAKDPPVNITRRLSAIQGALGGAQQALNSYGAAMRASARTHNERVFRQAEISRRKMVDDRIREQQEQQRLKAIAEQERRPVVLQPVGYLAPARPWDDTGWKIGVAIAQNVRGWDKFMRNVRVNLPGPR